MECFKRLKVYKKEVVYMMTEKQKKQIEDRINWIASHSYDPVVSGEWKGVNFVLEVLGYFGSYNFGEYKIVKLD